MSQIWAHFTKDNRCPACQHWDWACRQGQWRFICMRVKSNHPSKDGGWYHSYSENHPKPKAVIPPRRRLIPQLDIKRTQESFEEINLTPLANQLGVAEMSLKQLGCKWSEWQKAYVFPMQDGEGNVVGFRTRHLDGSKRAITGSRQGIFVPDTEPLNMVFLPEGPTDTAAFLTMGFYAIGRPTCNSGWQEIRKEMMRQGITRAVIVADNDDEKFRPNGESFRPGKDGSYKLKGELGFMSVVILPPSGIKDFRELLQKVGANVSRKIINDLVGSKVWSKR